MLQRGYKRKIRGWESDSQPRIQSCPENGAALSRPLCWLTLRRFSRLPQKMADNEPDLEWFNRPRNPPNLDPLGIDQSPSWTARDVQLDDERILALEST